MIKHLLYTTIDTNLDGLIATVFLLLVALVSALFYRHRGRRYARNKQGTMKSPGGFRFVYRYIQLTTIAGGIGAFLTNYPVFLELHDNVFLLYLGISVSTIAMALFISAKLSLGEHYSPCFDSFVPRDIVQEGLYRYMRHPMYMSNMILLTGAFIASGSIWILINVVLLIVYYVPSAIKEESVLSERFPRYADYADHTNKFIPNRKKSRRH